MLSWLIRMVFRVLVKGSERLRFDEPTILMPNHVSFLDAVILTAVLPKNVCFVVDIEIARQFWLPLKMRKHITVDSLNPYSVRKMLNLVKSGVPLVIFPEGRLTVTGGLMKIYNGIAFLALKSNANVIPLWLEGLHFSMFTRLKSKFPTRLLPQVTLSVGTPFRIRPHDETPMKQQKIRAAEDVLIGLQNLGFQSRVREGINLFDELVSTAHKFGLKTKIIEDINRKATYKDIILGANALSEAFKRLIADEPRVGVLLPNSIAHVVTLFALFKMGKTPAILNLSNGVDAWMDNCGTAGLKTILTAKAFVKKAKLEELIDELAMKVNVVYLEDVRASLTTAEKLKAALSTRRHRTNSPKGAEVVLFTSGTEAKPKGVVLSHDQLFANVHQANIVIDVTREDKFFNALPMFHSFGLTAGTLFPLLCGVPIYTYPSPLHYRVIPELVYDKNATVLFGTSTFLAGYAKHAHDYDFRSLRYVVAGAEKLKQETRDVWQHRFGIRLYEGYGATETAPVICVNSPLFFKEGSVGRPVPAIQTKLEPVEGIEGGGRLFVKGPNVMKGYLIDGKGFVPSGAWYDTGDVVSIDDRGFVTILARLKRFAKVAGEMVSLNVVEEVAAKAMNNHEALVAAVAIPDANKGEKMVVYATAPIEMKHILEVIQRERRSPLYMPSIIRLVDAIPLLGTGKTDYVTLQKMANSGL